MCAAAVEVNGLVRRFGDFAAVDDVSFSVQPGSSSASSDPTAPGKTTTISILCTLLKPTAGSASVAGHDVAREPARCAPASGWCSRRSRSTTT